MAKFEFLDDPQLLFPERVETERLVFEAIANSDISARDAFQIYSSEEYRMAMEYIPATPHWSMHETVEFLEDTIEQFNENEGSSYYIFEDDGDVGAVNGLIGAAGFSVEWDIKKAEFYIWLLPEYQQNGYSPERGNAFLELCFEELSLRTVRVKVLSNNNASERAVQEYIVENGGSFEGTLRNKKCINAKLCDLKVYSITYAEWYHNTE